MASRWRMELFLHLLLLNTYGFLWIRLQILRFPLVFGMCGSFPNV